jgi:hypothetical protein
MREPRHEPKSPLFEIFATSLFKNSLRGLLLSPGPRSARTSIVVPAWAARRMIVVALIGR